MQNLPLTKSGEPVDARFSRSKNFHHFPLFSKTATASESLNDSKAYG
jgi:hypothetical protein